MQSNMAECAVLDLRSNQTRPALYDHAYLHHVSFAAEFKFAELRLGNELLATVDLVA